MTDEIAEKAQSAIEYLAELERVIDDTDDLKLLRGFVEARDEFIVQLAALGFKFV